MPAMPLDLDWFRLIVRPFAVTAMFLLVLAEPEEKFKAWWRRRKAAKAERRRNALNAGNAGRRIAP